MIFFTNMLFLKETTKQIKEEYDLPVHSRMLFLKCVKNFASLK